VVYPSVYITSLYIIYGYRSIMTRSPNSELNPESWKKGCVKW